MAVPRGVVQPHPPCEKCLGAAWCGLEHIEMSTLASAPASNRILSISEVIRISSLSRASIYRAMKAGHFPAAIRLLPGSRVGWRQSDIDAWSAAPFDWNRPIDF